jgi:hypothetical protein
VLIIAHAASSNGLGDQPAQLPLTFCASDSACRPQPATLAVCCPPFPSVITCPQRCAFKQQLRVNSVSDLPKNFALMKVIEQTASRSALVELGAPPCSQCDPSQPRRAAVTFCDDCRSYFCEEHEQLLHAVATLENHQRVSLTKKAQQQQAAAQQDQFLAQAAAPLKEKLQRHCDQLKNIEAESQQLIRSLPQSESSLAIAVRTELELAPPDCD